MRVKSYDCDNLGDCFVVASPRNDARDEGCSGGGEVDKRASSRSAGVAQYMLSDTSELYEPVSDNIHDIITTLLAYVKCRDYKTLMSFADQCLVTDTLFYRHLSQVIVKYDVVYSSLLTPLTLLRESPHFT